jgi:DNA helicase HerA-like ATPase
MPSTDSLAALELHGRGERRLDWQLGLVPFADALDSAAVPSLAAIANLLATTTDDVVYQVLLTPKPDWTVAATDRRFKLQYGRDTFWQRIGQDYVSDTLPEAEYDLDELSHSRRERLLALDDADPRRSFDVNVRAVAFGETASETLEQFVTAFEPLSTPYYEPIPILTAGEAAFTTLARLRRCTPVTTLSSQARLRQHLPLASTRRPWLVCDPSTVASLCVLPEDRLSDDAARALGRRPADRTGLSLPVPDVLAHYDHGMTLGHPLTSDRQSTPMIALPPALQPLHVALIGKTGSGKSTAGVSAFVSNIEATDGANIIIDPKGDGMPIAYLRAHYARYSNLENVYYFDCAEVVPALSIFDIRDQLAAGIPREEATQRVAAQFNELLIGIMGRERYERAVRSPDIITYLVKALFDPIHGADAYSYHELHYALRRMHETRDAPPVMDPVLESNLGDIVASSKRSYDEVMQGVANRIEKVLLDYRLATLFNHVPTLDTSNSTVETNTSTATQPEAADEARDPPDPHFDFLAHLDTRSVVIFDLGGLDEEAKRLFTLILLTKLWTALKRRVEIRTRTNPDASLPLVNLYLEEAASIAHSGLLGELLSQSRAFGLYVTLALQYPGQLRAADEAAYRELLNDVSTFIVGNVGFDPHLAERLATADLPDRMVAARLRSLRRGEWLLKLPAPFFAEEPRPFYAESASLPAEHPEGDEPLSRAREHAFDALIDVIRQRSAERYGLVTATTDADGTEIPTASATSAGEGSPDSVTGPARRGLVYAIRQPKHATYDSELDALICTGCQRRYDPTAEGMKRALSCCFELAQTDRDDIPVIDYSLKLTPDEREATGYSEQQLWFLAAVHYAQQRRFDPVLEYDLLRDSMLRLQEYTGISPDEVQELLDADLLRHDCDYPHRLYSLSSDGRSLINETTREGLDYGDGAGDLGESSQHAMAVELGRLFIEREFVDDPASPVTQAVSYYPVPGDTEHRLDAAGLDATGEIIITLEAERINHDLIEAVPSDFDKMAACDPAEAIWLAMERKGAHEILRALNEPKHGPPRVSKTYSKNTAPQRFAIDTPGGTAIHTVGYLQKRLID